MLHEMRLRTVVATLRWFVTTRPSSHLNWLQFSYTASLPWSAAAAAAAAEAEATFLSVTMAAVWWSLLGKTDDLYEIN